jgi:hypothetical protein
MAGLQVYIYAASLLCKQCGEAQRHHLDGAFAENGIAPGTDDDDSDRYPQGPYPDGGGEADSPQHCDQCTKFLENPLTPDGESYVREQWEDYCETGVGNPAVLLEWLDRYDYVWSYFRDNLPEQYQATADYLEKGNF